MDVPGGQLATLRVHLHSVDTVDIGVGVSGTSMRHEAPQNKHWGARPKTSEQSLRAARLQNEIAPKKV